MKLLVHLVTKCLVFKPTSFFMFGGLMFFSFLSYFTGNISDNYDLKKLNTSTEFLISASSNNCDALSGSTIPYKTTECLENGMVILGGTADGMAVIPSGYSLVYILSDAVTGEVLILSATPQFSIFETGIYMMHAFVFDPSSFDLNTIQFGTTTVFDIFFNLEQGGGTICGSLEVSGSPITVYEITADIVSQLPDQCGACNGTASFSPANYIYNWSDGVISANRDDLCEGQYEVIATDPVTQCTYTFAVLVDLVNTLGADIQIVNLPKCTEANGEVLLDIYGGSGDYSISWSDGGVGAFRDDLVSGVYTYTITDNNSAGCILSETFTLVDEVVAEAVIDITNDPVVLDCANEPNGTVEFTTDFFTDFVFPETISVVNANGELVNNGSLAPGIYCILVNDGNGCIAGQQCFEVIATDPIIISSEIENADCDELGSICLTVNGGSPGYTFDWEDLPGTDNLADRNNLNPGIYNLTITDALGCTSVIGNLTVNDECDSCTQSDTIYLSLDVESAITSCIELEDCFDESQTDISLINGLFTGNSNYGSWIVDNEGCLSYTSEFISGEFVDTVCVVATFDGMTDTTCYIFSINDVNTPNQDTIYISTNEDMSYSDCLPLDELNGNFASIEIWYSLVNETGTLELDSDEPCFTYTPLPGESGPFIDTTAIIICDDLGICDTTVIIISVDKVDCQPIYEGADSLIAQDCNSLNPLCLNIPLANLFDYSITDNGAIYQGGFAGCDLDSMFTYLTIGFNTPGTYGLESWTINGQVFSLDNFENIQELVDSMNVWDPNANWTIQGLLISGGDFGNNYGNLIISENGTVIATVNPSLQLLPNGVAIGIDTGYHEIIVTDTITGCSALIEVFVSCSPEFNNDLDTLLTVYEGMTDTFCLDISGLSEISTINNICPDESNGNVDWSFIQGSACIVFSGELIGLDTLCIEICDTLLGICETSNIVIEVLPLTDTIEVTLITGFSDTICIDSSALAGNISIFENNCFGNNLDYFLDDDQYCVSFTGLSPGTDTLCIQICDDAGFCDETYIIVNVIPQTIDTITTEVITGFTDTICVDTSDLAGTIVSITNYCPGEAGIFIDFNIIDDYCISFEGLLPNGTENACIEICDEFGFCDTTILIVSSIEDSGIDPPVAVDDFGMTQMNSPVSLDILGNDTLNGTLLNIGIITEPVNGTVVFNSDLTITYIPEEELCEYVDSFTYFITTPAGADTATVVIEVTCEELLVYSGMSPNGDGINDGWIITGIDEFPENSVSVFNRWGNQVFYREGYSNINPFDGTWNGKLLPDGTYYYFIEAKGERGKMMRFSGYLQIHR